MFGSGGWSASKVKPLLKMAIHRLQINSNKKSALMKQQKREIAKLLAEQPVPKEEKARIRAEALIRDDNTVEAYEILQLECELIHQRIKLIDSTVHCPADMASCIATVIYAADRVEVPELNDIRKQFKAKYGKDFLNAAMTNAGGILNERVVAKLSVHPPTAILVNAYLEKIAEEFEVDWKPRSILPDDQYAPFAGPRGDTVGNASGLGKAVTGLSTNSLYKPRDDGSNDGGSSSDRGGSGTGGGIGGSAVKSFNVSAPYSTERLPPAIPATARVVTDKDAPLDYNGIPIVQATKYHPTNASAPSAHNLTTHDSEDDIPYAPNNVLSATNKNINLPNSNDDGVEDEYDTLAARFANLKH